LRWLFYYRHTILYGTREW